MSFLHGHAVRAERRLVVGRARSRWLDIGVPAEVIDQAAEFEAQWGGLALPPAPWYNGGPRAFMVTDMPEGSAEQGWWFPAGDQRFSVPYGFSVGPGGEFGLNGPRLKTALYASVHGWVESVALSYRASMFAEQITNVSGTAVDELDLSALEPVPLVAGLADTWWRSADLLMTVSRGEADTFDNPRLLQARQYEGLPEHAFWFD